MISIPLNSISQILRSFFSKLDGMYEKELPRALEARLVSVSASEYLENSGPRFGLGILSVHEWGGLGLDRNKMEMKLKLCWDIVAKSCPRNLLTQHHWQQQRDCGDQVWLRGWGWRAQRPVRVLADWGGDRGQARGWRHQQTAGGPGQPRQEQQRAPRGRGRQQVRVRGVWDRDPEQGRVHSLHLSLHRYRYDIMKIFTCGLEETQTKIFFYPTGEKQIQGSHDPQLAIRSMINN